MPTFESVSGVAKKKSTANSLKRTGFLLVPLAVLIFAVATAAQGPGPRAPDVSIDAATKAQVIDSLAQHLQSYVFPDVADRLSKMLRDHLARGEYDSVNSAKSFSKLLTDQMREIAHDAHLHVAYVGNFPASAPPKPSEPLQPDRKMLRQLQTHNYGFDDVKRLPGNIGYLKLTEFSDAQEGGSTAAATMAFLAHTDALIIDLRQNMGGSPGMVDLLASYFFEAIPPTHLNDLSMRRPGTTEHTIQQWWTLPYVPGSRYLDKEVYILTSRHTPSAAEEFTYDLKALKRATVVGESTWGGANPGEFVPLGSGFEAFIPAGEAVNPVTKRNWEGTGVEPDIKVVAADALKTAHVAAIKHLIERTTDAEELAALKQTIGAIESQQAGADEDKM